MLRSRSRVVSHFAPCLLVASLLPALPAGAAPLALHPSGDADAGIAAPAVPPAPVPTRVASTRGNMGGGFLEFLFGGGGQDTVMAPRYQPVLAPTAADEAAQRPIDPKFLPQTVDYAGPEKPGTIVIDTPRRFLFLVEPGGVARRYGIGVGREGFTWSGVKEITAKREWPDWRPPPEMLQRRPDLPTFMAGGPENPLGARAMYLGSSLYRIHGSNEPWTIGGAVSSGCIRMRNEDVIDLYERVKVGTRVIVI
jgi:lipoprotein-anchoring transpeptidase ErfK/SrfK